LSPVTFPFLSLQVSTLVGNFYSVSLQLDKTSYCHFDYLKTHYFLFPFWDKLSFYCELFYEYYSFSYFTCIYGCLVHCNMHSLSSFFSLMASLHFSSYHSFLVLFSSPVVSVAASGTACFIMFRCCSTCSLSFSVSSVLSASYFVFIVSWYNSFNLSTFHFFFCNFYYYLLWQVCVFF
jgi:hypothetical protein